MQAVTRLSLLPHMHGAILLDRLSSRGFCWTDSVAVAFAVVLAEACSLHAMNRAYAPEAMPRAGPGHAQGRTRAGPGQDQGVGTVGPPAVWHTRVCDPGASFAPAWTT